MIQRKNVPEMRRVSCSLSTFEAVAAASGEGKQGNWWLLGGHILTLGNAEQHAVGGKGFGCVFSVVVSLPEPPVGR